MASVPDAKVCRTLSCVSSLQFVDNLFRPDKAPYCSNCSRNADCLALLLVSRAASRRVWQAWHARSRCPARARGLLPGRLLAHALCQRGACVPGAVSIGFSSERARGLQDGEVPRDAEFARIRQYMIRRCRYAAALIMNVQARGVGGPHRPCGKPRSISCDSLHGPVTAECPPGPARQGPRTPTLHAHIAGGKSDWLHASARACTPALSHLLQVPEHGRDPDDIMHILEDWTDMQLEGFFRYVHRGWRGGSCGAWAGEQSTSAGGVRGTGCVGARCLLARPSVRQEPLVEACWLGILQSRPNSWPWGRLPSLPRPSATPTLTLTNPLPTPGAAATWWARCRRGTRWAACWCLTSPTSAWLPRSRRSWGSTRWGGGLCCHRLAHLAPHLLQCPSPCVYGEYRPGGGDVPDAHSLAPGVPPQWLLDRPQAMKAAMLKPPGSDNVMFDSSVVPKLTAGPGDGVRRLAGAAAFLIFLSAGQSCVLGSILWQTQGRNLLPCRAACVRTCCGRLAALLAV